MILKQGQLPQTLRAPDDVARFGAMDQRRLSDAGELSQFGAYEETLAPGAQSSERHWHEEEDEFLFVLTGTPTLVDNDGDHPLTPGDAVTWKAGVPNAHCIINRSTAPCSYLIVGTRVERDIVHYPDSGHTMFHQPPDWWVQDAAGNRLRGGMV